MNDILFVVLIGTLGFASTCIGLWQDYSDKRYKKNKFKGIKKEFYVLLVIGFCILILSIWQYFYTKSEERNERINSAKQTRYNDSLLQANIKKGIDSAIYEISSGFARSFNSQGIKMDSLNFSLSKIQDSVNANKSTFVEENPTLEILENGVSLDPLDENKRKLKIMITSLGGGASNFNVKSTIIALDKTGNLLAKAVDQVLIDKNDRIPKGMAKVVDFDVQPIGEIETIYIFTRGTYTNLNGRNFTRINSVYTFSPSIKATKKLFENEKKEVLKRFGL